MCWGRLLKGSNELFLEVFCAFTNALCVRSVFHGGLHASTNPWYLALVPLLMLSLQCVNTSAEYFKREHSLKSHILLYSVMLCDIPRKSVLGRG